MQLRNQKTKLLLLPLAVAVMTGCATSQHIAKDQVEIETENADRMLEQGRQFNAEPRASREFDDFFVLGSAYKASKYGDLPSTLRQNMVYKSKDMVSFSDLMTDLSRDLGLRFTYSSEAIDILSELEKPSEDSPKAADWITNASATTPEINVNYNKGEQPAASDVHGSGYVFSVDHQGSLALLLDRVSNKVGLYWEWRDDHVHVFLTKQKTFSIDFMPSEIKISSTVSTNRSNSDSGGGSNKTSQEVEESYETSNSYEELRENIESMLSADVGQFSLSENFGVLTVKDTPAVLEDIGDYIREINAVANTNIAIRTQVYELVVEDETDIGMDLSALLNVNDNVNLNFNSQFTSGTTPNITGSFVNANNKFQEAVSNLRANNALIDVSTVTDFVTSTKNNQAAPIQIANETGYVEEVERTPGVQGEAGSISLKPGTVLDGVTMTVLPRVLSDDSVDLSINFDIANLNSINEIRVGEGETESLIQLTDVTSKTFKNNLNISSGETVMLAGFEKTINASETNSIFGESAWWAGGSKKGGKKRVVNVILVTPYITNK